ncbi:MAG: SusC/RagA family TonB-linked outer membrane protein [Bacteroidales bacterium]|nr:SusC/RagA family TonB-linked outer membrane protein [Bacteroidales bacterium]
MKKRYTVLLMATALLTSPVAAQQADNTTLPQQSQKSDAGTEIVTGVVLDDATGAPVVAARLQVLGAPYSAMTDDNGRFSLKVPTDAAGRVMSEINVTGPDRNSMIVALRNRRELTVRLMESGYATKTSREVYTPLGMKEESHLMSAIGVFDRDNSISVKGSAEALLNGQVSGLQTQFRSGTDWSGANIYLRGINSIYANNMPLIVLDGLIIENSEFGVSQIEGQISTPFGCIDIKDIDQIVVLKDATSIYGAKGSNGAILIRTKHTSDQATHIDVTALMGVNMQPKSIPMLNASDSKRLLTDIAKSSGLTSTELSNLVWINSNKPQMQPDGSYLYPNYYKYNQSTDWQDEIFQRGFKQQYSLGVTGGDDVAIYGVSVGFQNKEGLVKGSDFQRYNARVNADINITNSIRLFANMNFVYGKKNLSNEGSVSYLNPIYTALVKAPFTTSLSVDQNNRPSKSWEDVDALGAANPAAVVSDIKSLNSFYRFMGSFTFDVDLWKGLKLSENFGLDFNKEREEIFHPSTGIPYEDLPTTSVDNVQIHRVERLFNIISETRLNYSKHLYEHQFDATVGFRYFHSKMEDDYGKGYNSAGNSYQTIGSGDASLHEIGGSLGSSNWLSIYGNVNYNWRNRYFAELTLSSDASSRFGDDVSTFQIYPGVNAGWLVSSEEFMKSAEWLNFLKVRAGFNASGNDDITNYSNRQYYVSQQILTTQGLVLGALKNSSLKPERMQKMNVGIDAALLNNRLNFSFDIYKSSVTDMLTYSTADDFTGMTTILNNGGELENSGFEVNVSGRVFTNKNFQWDLSLNLAHNKNEIKKLETGSFQTTVGDGSVLTRVGSAAGIFYGYQTNGVYSTTAEAQADGLTTMVGAVAEPMQAGDVRFIDNKADGIINDDDCTEIGNPNPTIFGGLTSVMKSHGFTLQADFTFASGNDIYNYTRSQLESMSSYSNQTKNTLLRWRTEGDVTNYPRAAYGDSHKNNRFSDRWIEDGSFLKLKSVTLSYDFNLQTDFITGLTVYGTCENVFCATKYSGYDPEICCSSSNNPLYQGVDCFTTPTARTFYIGLKLGL